MLALEDAAIRDALRGVIGLGLFVRLSTAAGEAAFPGYAPCWVAAADWTVSGRMATAPQQTFERTDAGPAQMVSGYFLSRPDGSVVGREDFDDAQAPYKLQNAGDLVLLAPTIEQAQPS